MINPHPRNISVTRPDQHNAQITQGACRGTAGGAVVKLPGSGARPEGPLGPS